MREAGKDAYLGIPRARCRPHFDRCSLPRLSLCYLVVPIVPSRLKRLQDPNDKSCILPRTARIRSDRLGDLPAFRGRCPVPSTRRTSRSSIDWRPVTTGRAGMPRRRMWHRRGGGRRRVGGPGWAVRRRRRSRVIAFDHARTVIESGAADVPHTRTLRRAPLGRENRRRVPSRPRPPRTLRVQLHALLSAHSRLDCEAVCAPPFAHCGHCPLQMG